MKLKPSVKPWSKEGILQILIVGLLYGILILENRYFLSFQAWREVRFVTFVPVIGGFIFGLPGAIGTILGNLIGSLTTKAPLYITVASCITNFYLAYLPHVLWYSLKNKRAGSFIADSKSYVKWLLCLLVNTFLFASYLSAMLNSRYLNNPEQSFSAMMLLLSCDYIYPVIFSLPVIIYLRSRDFTFYYPNPSPVKYPQARTMVLAVAIGLALIHDTLLLTGNIPDGWAKPCFVIGAVLLGLCCALPCDFRPQENERIQEPLVASISSKLVIYGSLALLGITAFVISFGLYTEFIEDDLDMWGIINTRLFIFLNIVLAGIYFFLRSFEKKVAQPLEALTEKVSSYMSTGQLEQEETHQAPSRIEEMRVLETSYDKMRKDIQSYVANLKIAHAKEQAFQAQMDIARSIRLGALPDMQEVNAKLQKFAASYKVSAEFATLQDSSEDMYECFLVDKEHLFLSVTGVAGKGIPVALFAIMCQTLLSNGANFLDGRERSLDALVAAVNDRLHESNEEHFSVCAWAGYLEFATGKLTYVNAGQLPPIVTKNGSQECLSELSGPTLGLAKGAGYTLYTTSLEAGSELKIATQAGTWLKLERE